MAVGAAQAVNDAKKTKQILVIGFNADPIALEAIKSGVMAATLAQFPEAMGRMTVQIMDQILKKQPVKFDDPEKKEVYAPVKMVTQENLESFLAER